MRNFALCVALFSVLFGTVACSNDGPSPENSKPAEPLAEGEARCFTCYKPFPKEQLNNSSGELLCPDCASK